VKQYTKALEEATSQFQAEEQAERLHQMASTGQWMAQQEAKYNNLDTQLMTAKLNVERQCWKICAG